MNNAFINKLIKKLEKNLHINENNNLIEELFYNRSEKFHEAITKNPKYKAYMKKINELGSVSSACKLHRADLCTLLLGMAELDNFPNTPVPVVIDEAVNIVAKYSTESSTDFVNGVLAEYAKEK